MTVASCAKIILTAGGTGGHVFPAIALGQHLRQQGYDVHMVTDSRGEAYFKDSGFVPKVLITQNLGSGSLVKRLVRLLPLCWQGRCYLKEQKPALVIGFGGYTSFPLVWGAWMLGLPLLLHEQNAVLGKVNRLLARWAGRTLGGVMLSFPQTTGTEGIAPEKIGVTGNFVRWAFLVPGRPYALPAVPAQAQEGDLHIVALGGSQGAAGVARMTLDAVGLLSDDLKKRLHLTLQAPASHIPSLEEDWPTYEKGGEDKTVPNKVKGTLQPFYTDVATLLRQAHVVIGRAGASSVWELMATQRPGIFLPFAAAADDHQRCNAQFMVHRHGGWMLADEQMSSLDLHGLLARILKGEDGFQELQLKVVGMAALHQEIYAIDPVVRAQAWVEKSLGQQQD